MITWAAIARLALQIAHLAAQYATTEQLKAAGADALAAGAIASNNIVRVDKTIDYLSANLALS